MPSFAPGPDRVKANGDLADLYIMSQKIEQLLKCLSIGLQGWLHKCLSIGLGIAVLAGHAMAQQDDAVRAASSDRVRVQGVLLSDHRRSALVNGESLREGASIGDVEVVQITAHAVTLRRGDHELEVLVGSSGDWSRPTRARRLSETAAPLSHRSGDEDRSEYSRARTVEVLDGDTLSAIALRYRHEGIDLQRMMRAIFAANPQAFDGTIHRLLAGATLRLPERDKVATMEGTFAGVETYERHSPASHRRNEPSVARPAMSNERRYGPVVTGDTLSTIALRFARPGYSQAQMMIALFEANPHAFGTNINVLFAGATLTMPSSDQLNALNRQSASLEVTRHVKAWRLRSDAGLIAQAPPSMTTIPAKPQDSS